MKLYQTHYRNKFVKTNRKFPDINFFAYICIHIKQKCMEKKVMTREEALLRFEKAKAKKRECIKKLEQEMKEAYEKRTGLKATYFSAL